MKKNTSKALAILCVVALLLSVINVGFFITASSAVQNNMVLSSDSDMSYLGKYGSNLLAGSSVETSAVTDGAEQAVKLTATAVTLTNGSTQYGSQIQLDGIWDNDYSFSKANANSYTQLTFTTNGAIDNPAKFLIAHAPNSRQSDSYFYGRWYSIYASATKDTLYDAANLVYEYKDANAGVEQIIDISDKNLTGIKYFGIRYYYRGQVGAILLPSEIALYAERANVENNSSYSVGSNGSYATNEDLGKNALAGSTITSTYTYLGDDKGEFSCANYSNIANLTNGLTDAFVTYQATGWVNGYTPTTSTYIDINFALPTAANNIEEFLMAFPNSNGNTPSGWYAVYMSDTEPGLNTASPVITWKDLNNTQQEQIFDISDKNLSNVKYVRVRLYDLDFAVICKISEIGMYCGRTVSLTAGSFTSDANNSYEKVYGKNMLSGSVVTGAITDGTDANTFSHPPTTALVDGTNNAMVMVQTSAKIGSANDYNQTAEYVDIKFTTPGLLNNIETFLIAWDTPARVNHATQPTGTTGTSMHYAIYASNTEADLFKTPIYEHKSSSRQGNEHIIDLVPANLANVKYFAVRFYEMSLWATCITPSEIALYGKNITLTTSGFTADANGSYSSVYGANILATTSMVSTVVDGTNAGNTFKQAGQWGTPTQSFLTDGNATAVNQIQTKEAIGASNDYEQNEEYVEILFSATTPIEDIKTFLIAWDTPARVTNNGTGTTGTSMHYAIFAGDALDKLYDKPLYEYQSSARTGNEHRIDLSEAKLTGVKFFSIRIYEMSLWTTCITPSEIALYGSGIAPEIINSHKSATFTDQFGPNRLAESVITGFETNDNGTTKQDVTGLAGGLIDGVIGQYSNMVSHNFNKPDECLCNSTNNAIDQTNAYFQVDFAINGEVDNPEKFFLAFHEGSDTSISSQHYAFFMSDEESDLYDDANKIYEYTSTTGAGQGVEHLYDISGLNITDVKFVGVRLYHRGYKGHVQHLIELGMFGGTFTLDTTKIHQTKAYHEDLSQFGQNYLRWHAVTSTATNGTKTVDAPISNSNLTDSVINMYMFSADNSVLTTANNSNDQKKAYIQWTFDLCGVLNNPSKFIFDFHEGSNAEISSRHYEVFASDREDTLYNSANSIYEYKSSTGVGEGVQHQLRIDHLNLTGLKYFGVRIYHRGYQGNIQHTADIGLYGDSNTTFVADMTKLALQVEGTHKNASWVSVYGTNYFATAEGSIIATNGTTTEELYCPVILTEDRFTENTMTTSSGVLNKNNNWSPSNPQKAAYIQVTEKLAGTITNPGRVSIAYHEGNDAARASRCYEVFASKTLEDLYKPASSIYYYEGVAKGVEHHIDTSGMNLEDIRYFGIRFYHRTSVSMENGVYVENGEGIFLSELGLFGGTFTKDAVIDSIETSGKVDGENLLQNANIFASAYKNNQYLGDIMADFSAVIDGNEESGAIINHEDMPQTDTTLGNGASGKDNYYTLDFYLRYNTFVDAIRIVNAKKAADRMQRYEIYVSTQIGNLYDRSNLVFQGYEGSEITNEQYKAGNEQVQIFNFKKDQVFGRYFGIKVYETGDGASTAQVDLLDVELYGTEKPYSVSSGVHYTESDFNAHGISLIGGKTAFRIRNNGTVQSTYIDDTKPMTDGKFGAFMGISEYKDDGAYDIMYVIDPDIPYTIDKFFLAGISNPKNWNEQWFTAKYEIYAAIDLDDLFLPENRVYDYDFERDGLSRYQIVNFDGTVNACYVAIRIIDSTAFNEDQVGVRIEEFALYGEEADIDYQPTNLSSYLPVTAYLTDSNDKVSEVSDKDFTKEENIYISDSDETTIADFTTNNQALDLVFNLCNDAEISKIKVLAESEKLSYDVYAAMDIGEIWSETSLIATYNGSDTPFSVGEEEELLTARYIRISFPKTNGKKVTVKDIQVIGLENQLLKHKAISRALDGNKASVFKRDLKTNELTYDNFKEGGVLFDADYYGAAMTYVGVQGVSSANILVNLDGLKNVDEISVYFTRHMIRNHPLELKIYTSNTFDGAMDFSAEPVATFKGLPKEGKYTVSFKPQLARYIRVEVTKNNYDAKTGEGDYINKENMVLAFSEIEVFGTKVVGMQTDFDRDDILSFTDKETGISWEIIRVDESDIITSVYSSKLVKYKASNWQKTSLNQSPYYKVDDDNVYGFEFFDFFGNQVKSIEGREIRVKLPIDSEYLGGGSAIGNATDPKVIEMIESNDGDGYLYTNFVYKPDSKVAILLATNAEDEYWSTIGELENFPGDEEEEDDSDLDFDLDLDLDDGSDFLGDEDFEDATTGSKTKITKTITRSFPPIWLIILDGALVLLFLAAVVMFIIVTVKRAKAKKAGEI